MIELITFPQTSEQDQELCCQAIDLINEVNTASLNPNTTLGRTHILETSKDRQAQSGFRATSAQSTDTELLSSRGKSIPTTHPTTAPALLSHFMVNCW